MRSTDEVLDELEVGYLSREMRDLLIKVARAALALARAEHWDLVYSDDREDHGLWGEAADLMRALDALKGSHG
ncbi:MAG: hypothetical protein FWC87_00095 [Acidimicrobiaceae bacterium]|nr:hypothetical protein [Acidimicrobiaceae bacterium]